MFSNTDRYMLYYTRPGNFLCRSPCIQYSYQCKNLYTPDSCLYKFPCTLGNFLCKNLYIPGSHQYKIRYMFQCNFLYTHNKGQYIHCDNLFRTYLQPLFFPR